MPTTLSLGAIAVDCADAATVAAFWSQAFDRELASEPPPSPYFAKLEAGDGGPAMLFMAVPEPRETKNRLHLDLVAADPEAEVERLVGLGAEVQYAKDEWGVQWTTLADPEGNLFCVAGDRA